MNGTQGLYSSIERRQKIRVFSLLLPCILFLLFLFAFPLLRMVWLSVFTPEFSLINYEKIFKVTVYFRVVLISLRIALTTTIVCVLLGYPVAYLLNSVSDPKRNLLIIAVILPFFLSLLVRVFGWYVILGRQGMINFLLMKLNITDQPLQLLFNNIGVHAGMVNMLLPYMILTLYSVMRGIDKNLMKAASNLGAKPSRAFIDVFFPLSMPGIAAGSMIVFILAVGYFIIPALMGGRKEIMIAQLIRTTVSELMDWQFGAALSILLLVITGIFITVFNHYMGLDRMWGGEGKASSEIKSRVFKRLNNQLIKLVDRISSLLFIKKVGRIISICINSFVERYNRLTVVNDGSVDKMARAFIFKPGYYVVCGLVLCFLMAPIFVIIPMSFSSAKYLTFPPPGFSLQWYQNYFTSTKWLAATYQSFKVASITALLASFLGIPASISLVRARFRGKNIANTFVMLPIIIPSIIIAIASYFIFTKLHLVGTTMAIALSHTIITVPLIITAFSASLKGFDQTLERASMNLGAGPVKSFIKISLPILAPAAFSGAFFAFMRSFDEPVISLFMCGPDTRTLPIRMWEGIREEVDPTITAVSTLLMLFCIIGLLSSWWFQARNKSVQ